MCVCVCFPSGCTGALARELAREYPRLKVTVFDLPEVIEHVSSFHPEGRQPERLRFVPGKRSFLCALGRRWANRVRLCTAWVCVRGLRLSVRVYLRLHVCLSVSGLCACICVCTCICV